MVGVLIRMKLVVIRNAMTGTRAIWMVTGGLVGSVLALGTIVLSLVSGGHPTVVPDLLATVYLTWMIGWIVGPIWAGSSVLRVHHFAMLGIPRRKLALGLLGAAFVGIAPAVTLLAFTSMVTYAASRGFLVVLVAIPAVVLQLACVVLLSRLATVALSKVARTRSGAALNGVLFAIMLVLTQSGWMVLVGLLSSGVLEQGFPAGFSQAVRVAPSGWGLVAVEATADGSWLLTLAALSGMLALITVLLTVWGHTLGEPRGGRAVIRGSRRAKPARGLLAGPTGAVLQKELHTWWRDPARTAAISAPLAWGLCTALLPLTFGSPLLLPWAAPLIALMAATFMANLYVYDGTALWLTLQHGSERADLRARQWAYLLVFTPVTLLVAVGFTAWSGLTWAWPWVLALLPAILGGGVGLVATSSVFALTPGPDAHERAENPLESAEGAGTGFLVFFAGLVPPLPAAGVVLAGTVLDNDMLRWAGVPVGIGTGVALAWSLGRIAYQRLEATGPELLFLMRTGRPATASEDAAPKASARSTVIQTVGWTLGSIALFPQGLLPILFKLTGNTDVTVWHLAMHVPEPLGWATAIAMVLLGSYLYRLAIKDLKSPTTTQSDTSPDDGSRQPAVRA